MTMSETVYSVIYIFMPTCLIQLDIENMIIIPESDICPAGGI